MDIFDKPTVNRLILDYARQYLRADTLAELHPVLDDIDTRLKSLDASLLPLRDGV